MHDLRQIRAQPEAFDRGLARRGMAAISERILDLDRRHRAAQTALQDMLQRRNEASKQIGQAKRSGGDAAELVAEIQALKDRIATGEDQGRALEAELDGILAGLPNLPADDVPDGGSEDDNLEIRQHGGKPEFDFTPREHFDIGEALGQMDFEAAAALSGSRFVVLRGGLARLERALGNFMLDLHITEHGFTETAPPVLVRDAALYGTGQLPKFAEDLYRTKDGYWLIPTSEVPLTNLSAGQVHEAEELPIRRTAWTQCFRSEAGAASKDTRGMLRQHQFGKVEMVCITHPDLSAAELDRMTGCAEEVLKRLGLHYRVVALCTGDLGFGARKTHDIEAWLPGQGAYREISSCSNCGDFQARRMSARFRVKGQKGTQFVHTLNGSGLATGRTLIAVIENYQNADGSVTVPDVLRPYMGGLERIAMEAA